MTLTTRTDRSPFAGHGEGGARAMRASAFAASGDRITQHETARKRARVTGRA